MKILVTGSAGHLGEALVLALREQGREVVGTDLKFSPLTDFSGDLADRAFVKQVLRGAGAIVHAATLHKPHVATHTRQQFVDTNVTGTLNLLEEAIAQGISRFVFTSTTSAFGDALTPPDGEPAAWITEDVVPVPKNIYGVTKVAAENLCELFHRNQRLPVVILRTSRFFPEEDDRAETRAAYADANAKANEYLYRRVDIEDVVSAHVAALECAPRIGFGRYIISSTTPFTREHLSALRGGAPRVVASLFPEFVAVYSRLGWRMFPDIERVYVNARARRELGWAPRHDFGSVLAAGGDVKSPLARRIGAKGYHASAFTGAPYPTETR